MLSTDTTRPLDERLIAALRRVLVARAELREAEAQFQTLVQIRDARDLIAREQQGHDR